MYRPKTAVISTENAGFAPKAFFCSMKIFGLFQNQGKNLNFAKKQVW
jgi:hypothetical protein